MERRKSVTGPTAAVTVRWREKLVFEGGAPGRPAVTVDGDSKLATSPVELPSVNSSARHPVAAPPLKWPTRTRPVASGLPVAGLPPSPANVR